MAEIVQGKKIAKSIYKRLEKKVAILKKKGITPKLGVILVGDDKPSQTYVRKKGQAAEKIGVDFVLKQFPASISEKKLIEEINKMQKPAQKFTGLIVQLPLPKKMNVGKVLETINPDIDVDCLTQTNLGKLVTGSYKIKPPTPDGMMEILKKHKVQLKGKRVCVVGAGALVGKPLVNMLMNEEATVSVCNYFTPSLKEYTQNADVIMTGVGVHKLIKGSMVKKGVVVVDAGVTFVKGKMYGDVDFPTVSKKASVITPVPGGVGPLTVAKLIENTVICADKLLKDKK
ncbi:bifunctional methylenetetrahydrofolate dehydrogenase/methenyltetrahydrofolate cyclohydrolase [Patescibacteria group bacterium]|nr:bifunctional methylenetetrahydrofolate dehydrogenase/methenyltetrahydrofolate cyclohydrolase [Patescibacteria group bacterium]MBU1673339.1 bifunctional methylenetetrahydrofolate dehydrogenase/methenyltetrahydrofolate cyclohydrolase [Patescibacteria group bacterium]MBU1963542.1 bifunctional methylenetetrahydrofolate dehydrogenase/methenyltetrahydrofolate cyclohydrolase [Patescibacteria group bacterium]